MWSINLLHDHDYCIPRSPFSSIPFYIFYVPWIILSVLQISCVYLAFINFVDYKRWVDLSQEDTFVRLTVFFFLSLLIFNVTVFSWIFKIQRARLFTINFNSDREHFKFDLRGKFDSNERVFPRSPWRFLFPMHTYVSLILFAQTCAILPFTP